MNSWQITQVLERVTEHAAADFWVQQSDMLAGYGLRSLRPIEQVLPRACPVVSSNGELPTAEECWALATLGRLPHLVASFRNSAVAPRAHLGSGQNSASHVPHQ